MQRTKMAGVGTLQQVEEISSEKRREADLEKMAARRTQYAARKERSIKEDTEAEIRAQVEHLDEVARVRKVVAAMRYGTSGEGGDQLTETKGEGP